MKTGHRDMKQRGPDRRVRRDLLHFPERRSGFDRRMTTAAGWRGMWDASLHKYRENKITFMIVLATIIVFNYVDYLLTVRVLRAGGAELNPIMAHLFEISPVVAATAKLGAVGAAVLILLMLRRYRRTLEASLVLLAAFTALMFYHAAIAVRLA